MTLPLHLFCHRSGSGPHPRLPPFLQSSVYRTASLQLIHLKFVLSTAANQRALKHRCGHTTSCCNCHWLPTAHRKKCFWVWSGRPSPHLLPHSINTKLPGPPLITTTPCFCAVSSAENAFPSLSFFKTQFRHHLLWRPVLVPTIASIATPR